MRELPQMGSVGEKRCILARRASARRRLRPTRLMIVFAALLLERRIIGPSVRFSELLRLRCRTERMFRYVTSSIALRTLADGTVRLACQLYCLRSVFTANEMTPWRFDAQLIADFM